MSSRVYKYGARKIDDVELRKQMDLGHKYYNQLVEAENARREKAWGGPEAPKPPDGADRKTIKAHWKTVRDRVYRTGQPAKSGRCYLDKKPLREAIAAEGLWNGTYLHIEQAFDQAAGSTDVIRRVSFRSWRQGKIAAVQVRAPYRKPAARGLMYSVAPATDKRKGRHAKPEHRNSNGRLSGRRSKQFATVQIRLGTKNNKPLFSEPIPIVLHRPYTGEPTWVKVIVKPRAGREIWSVQFTCKDPDPIEPEKSAKDGIVAVDVCWRKIDDSLRIAYARDGQGNTDEFKLGPQWMELAKRADRIRSARDSRLNELQKNDSRFAKLKSPASVWRVIKKQNITDKAVLDWARRERHLHQYELGCRRRSVAHRRDQTRKWLRDLRRRYRTVVVKNSQHKKLKEKKDLVKPARRQGHHAAPGEVIEEIGRVFDRTTGVEVVRADHTTNQCPVCSYINNHGPERVVICEQCGDAQDRDDVSTQNMLRLYAAGDTKKPTARKQGAKFAKRHRNSDSADNASPSA